MPNSKPSVKSTPPPDLMKERDEVLQSFNRSARLTEQFMGEYSRMRTRLLEVEDENFRLRAQLEADDKVARLLRQVENLERERTDLLKRTERAEKAQDRFDERFGEVETEFSQLANLFVASNQLHASLSPRGVTRRIKEILAQLVGAESYAMYFLSADGRELLPMASEGVPGDKLLPLQLEGTLVGRVLLGHSAKIDEERDVHVPDYNDPPAIVPLVVDERAVGAIVIYSTLEQKPRFSRTDFELFKLLGQHAAAALVGAALFEGGGHKLPGADAFRDVSI
jgi:GAF domain